MNLPLMSAYKSASMFIDVWMSHCSWWLCGCRWCQTVYPVEGEAVFLGCSVTRMREMWHEARRQERKIRCLMVDYQRRAERRRQHYEKIVRLVFSWKSRAWFARLHCESASEFFVSRFNGTQHAIHTLSYCLKKIPSNVQLLSLNIRVVVCAFMISQGFVFLQKLDPTQFLRIQGCPLKIHWEQSVALAAEGPQSMWVWPYYV